jgi:peptide/nickel transport system ATP-binding protein
MQHGRVVEHGDPEAIFGDPQHAYTRRLVAAIPGRREPVR